MRHAYRLAILGHLALIAAALPGLSSPAEARPLRGYYEARLETPVAEAATPVLSGVAWSCAGEVCTAPKAGSRPEVVCARLARKVGPLASFSAAGKGLEPAALARCNGD